MSNITDRDRAKKYCDHCQGNGYYEDYLGSCGDPECCGGPWQIKCKFCENEWEPEDD